MVACGINELYLRKAKSSGTKCWSFINDPSDRRKVLINYESLKDQYKKMVISKFGNPYEYMAKEPIRKMVKPDFKAEDHFRSYRFDNDKSLS